MALSANVDNIESLKRLRARVIRFAEVISAAVSEASADATRTMQWLELEQNLKWKSEQRKRHDKLQQALEQLRHKQLYKGPSGEKQSVVDEMARVKVCRAACEEAEWKLRKIAEHKSKLQRETVMFQGVLSRLGGIASASAPAAAAELTVLLNHLEQYMRSAPVELGSSADTGGGGAQALSETGSMTRAPAEQRDEWRTFTARAVHALRIHSAEVVLELDITGRIGVVKDGFSGRIYVGALGKLGEPRLAELTGLPLNDWTSAGVWQQQVLEALLEPGEQGVIVEDVGWTRVPHHRPGVGQGGR
jgi:hypothetical protein